MALLRTLGVLSLLLALWPGCNGCKDSATPPTPVFGDVQLGVRASVSSGAGLPALNSSELLSLLEGDVVVDEVRLNLRRVDLKPDTFSDPGVEYEGPFVVNLVEGGEAVSEETPAFGVVSVPVDTYSRIRFRIDPVNSEELPSGLEGDPVVQSSLIGNTLVVEGSFEEAEDNDLDGSGDVSEIPFRFVSDMGADLRLNIPDRFSVTQVGTSFIFLALRLSSWISPALDRLQALTPGDLTEGWAILADHSDSEVIRELVDLIEDAIRGGTKFAESEDDEEFEEEEADEESYSEIDFDEEEEEEGEEEPSGEEDLILEEVRVSLREFTLDADDDLNFEGPFALSVVREGARVDLSDPPIGELGVPEGDYESLELVFDELPPSQVPEGSQGDETITTFLVDGTFVVTGWFLESEENDIDGDGEQGFVSFVLVSDDRTESFATEGVTGDVDGFVFSLLDPSSWFDGVLELLQGLDPLLLEDGTFFLSDSSHSDEIQAIVELVESNLDDSLP